MSYALVGTAGALVGTGSTSASPTFGTGETRTAGNLLTCWSTSLGTSAAIPGTPSGWSLAKSITTSSFQAIAIFYKRAAGGDAAPTITASGGRVYASLAEFSGNAASVILDQSGSGTSTAGTITVTASAPDTQSGDLVLYVGAECLSIASTNGIINATLNNATAIDTALHNTSSADQFEWGYGITTSNASANSCSFTRSGTLIDTAAMAIVSFNPQSSQGNMLLVL